MRQHDGDPPDETPEAIQERLGRAFREKSITPEEIRAMSTQELKALIDIAEDKLERH